MPRVKYATVLRVLFIIGLFCVWVQILLSATGDGLDRDGETNSDLAGLTLEPYTQLINEYEYEDELMNSNETSEQVLALVPNELHKYLTVHARNASGNATDRNGTPRNVSEILRRIHRYNDAQTIYNEDVFGPVNNDTLIIAIQEIHSRTTMFTHELALVSANSFSYSSTLNAIARHNSD